MPSVFDFDSAEETTTRTCPALGPKGLIVEDVEFCDARLDTVALATRLSRPQWHYVLQHSQDLGVEQ